MTRTSILVFGKQREALDGWTQSVVQRCKNWGVNLTGPVTPSRAEVYRQKGQIEFESKNPDARYASWFEGLELTDQEWYALIPGEDSEECVDVFARMFWLEDDRAVRKLVKEDLPRELFFRVEVIQTEYTPSHNTEDNHLVGAEKPGHNDEAGVMQHLNDEFDLAE